MEYLPITSLGGLGAGLSIKFRRYAALFLLSLAVPAAVILSSGRACFAQPDAKPGPAAREPEFSHNLVLNINPGIPSYLVFTAKTERPLSVRAVVVADGRLLVIPMRINNEDKNEYRGSFPTPETSLSYEFQAVFKDGSTFLSQAFSANPGCAREEAEKLIADAQSYPNQKDLLSEALNEEKEIGQLEYIISSLSKLAGEDNQ